MPRPAPCSSPEPCGQPVRCPSPCSGPNPVPYRQELGCHESNPCRLDTEGPRCGSYNFTQRQESNGSCESGDVFSGSHGLSGCGDQGNTCGGMNCGAYGGAKGAYF
nr:unnamed protein product [Mus musculus]